ncbi:MAG: IS1380 family transposase, partial [Cytophagales bacterium]
MSREPLTNGDLLTDSHFSYRGIITNDLTNSDLEVLTYYNQIGGQEIILDEMNNDFGWKKLPFSFLNENTIFMSIMAVCRSFYIYIIEKYSKVISFLS